MNDFNTAIRNFGTVEHNGATLALVQTAYANNYGTDGGVRYYAKAIINEDGAEYLVAWDTTAQWDANEAAYKADPTNVSPQEDESDACDWSAPADVIAL